MLKVGILNLHFSKRMGAVIQAFALREVLMREYKHQARIVNFVPFKLCSLAFPWFEFVDPLKLIRKHVSLYRSFGLSFKQFVRNLAGEYTYIITNAKTMVRNENAYRAFVREFLQVTDPPVLSVDSLRNELSKYDVVIVGSDVVWHPDTLRHSDFAYLLPFKLSTTRKVAFSVGIGISPETIFKNEKFANIYKLCVRDFKFVSLREKSHAEYLSRALGKTVHHTLDPTLLVPKDSLDIVASKPRSFPYREGEYVFAYNLDEEILPLAVKLAERYKLPLVVRRRPSFVPLAKYRTHKNIEGCFQWNQKALGRYCG